MTENQKCWVEFIRKAYYTPKTYSYTLNFTPQLDDYLR